ncbi:MAG: hypothetical protein N2379_06665 [Verrucomicrobiae bacterium]|nr:hypothetical protein [Verrucomicrobiae bacterium]
MNQIEAAQHIYANVEAEQSPRKRGGFQTLFYTHEFLSEAEVEELESHLVYFRMEANPRKRLFFRLRTGKFVVAQLVPLAGADLLGRQGRYLAHSLVFLPEGFAKLYANPLCVFEQFQFCTTVEEAWKAGDGRTCTIPPAQIIPPECGAEAAPRLQILFDWPNQEFKKLLILALRAKELAAKRVSVAFVGEPRTIERVLEGVFHCLPTDLRLACTFDTHFAGCNPVTLYYWAIGFSESPSGHGGIVVDTREKVVRTSEPVSPTNPHEQWVAAMIDKRAFPFLVFHRDTSYALYTQLQTGEPVPAGGEIPPEVIESFFQVNQEYVRGRARTKLSNQITPELADIVLECVLQKSTPPKLFKAILNGFPLPELSEALWEIYEERGFHRPNSAEMEAIGVLLQRYEHTLLQCLWLSWKRSHEQLRSCLAKLSDAEYQKFVRSAVRAQLVDPLNLLVPGKASAFLDIYVSTGVPRTWEIVKLAKALVEQNEIRTLTKLAPLFDTLPQKELRRLHELLRHHPETPPPLIQELESRLAAKESEKAPTVCSRGRRIISNFFGKIMRSKREP